MDFRSRLVELQGRDGRNEEEERTTTTRFNSSRFLKSVRFPQDSPELWEHGVK